MERLSHCHNAKVVPGSMLGRTICSSCGHPVPRVRIRIAKETEIKESDEGFPEDKKRFQTVVYPDERDFIRHLQAIGKKSACGVAGFRTTDRKRVNCKNCMRYL